MFLARIASLRRSVWIGPRTLGRDLTVVTGSRNAKDVSRSSAPTKEFTQGFTRLFVQNVPLDATWEELQDHFAGSGGKYVTLSVDQATQKPKGCGLISYDTFESAENAVRTMNGSTLRNNVLSVRLDRKMGATGTMVASSASPTGVAQPKASTHNGGNGTPTSPINAAAAAKECVAQIKAKYAMAGRSRQSLRSLIRESKADEQQKLQDSEKDSIGSVPKIDTQAVPPAQAADDGGYSRLITDNIPIPPTVLARIQDLLIERDAHRDAKEFARADEVHVLLRHKYGVQCDDLHRLWRVKFIPSGGPLPPAGSAADDKCEVMGPSDRPLVIKLLQAMAKEPPSEFTRRVSAEKPLPLTSSETARVASIAASAAAAAPLVTPQSASASASKAYTRDSKDIVYLGRSEVAIVTSLVDERASLLADPSADPSALADVERRLREEFSVHCDDDARTWAVVYGRQKGRAASSDRRGGSRDRTGQRESWSDLKPASSTEGSLRSGARSSSPVAEVARQDSHRGRPSVTPVVSTTSFVTESVASPASSTGSSGLYRRDSADIVYLGRSEVAAVTELVSKRATLLSDPVTNAAEVRNVESSLLEEFSVQCNDATHTWAVVYKRSSSSASPKRGSRAGGSSPGRNSRRSYSTSVQRWAELGEKTGATAYQRAGSDRAALKNDEVTEIAELVSHRAALLQEGDTSGAAWIAEELMQFHSVACDDARRTWAVVLPPAQGTPSESSTAALKVKATTVPATAPATAMYTRDPSDIVFVGRADVAAITELVWQRADCLAGGDLDSVEDIADRLRAEYSVDCDDDNQTWSVIYDRPGKKKQAGTPSKPSKAAVGTKNPATSPQRVRKPAAAQQASPDVGDVEVSQEQGASASGSSDYPTPRRPTKLGAPSGNKPKTTAVVEAYSRDPTDVQKLTPEEVTTIAKLVQERAAHRAGNNTAAAKSIDGWLRQRFSVRCDDTAHTWAVTADPALAQDTAPESTTAVQRKAKTVPSVAMYSRNPTDLHDLSPEEVASITTLVQERAGHLAKKKAAAAKNIDDWLRQKYCVQCDDAARTWSVSTELIAQVGWSAPSGNGDADGTCVRCEADLVYLPPQEVKEITDLVSRLTECLRGDNAVGVKRLMKKLRKKFGVVVDVSAHTWAVQSDLRSGIAAAPTVASRPPSSGRRPPPGTYLRDKTDQAAIEPQAFNSVTALVNRFAQWLREGDTERAERAQRKLRKRFGVECDDATRTWAVRHEVVPTSEPEPYRRKRGNKPELTPDAYGTISNLTRERQRYLGSTKLWERKKLADLDARLLKEFSVVCNDVKKTFKVVKSPRDSTAADSASAPAPYQRDERDTNALSEEDRARIEALVGQRAALVDQSHRVEAAAVAQHLRQESGVFVKDVARTWRATSAEERQWFAKVAEASRAL